MVGEARGDSADRANFVPASECQRSNSQEPINKGAENKASRPGKRQPQTGRRPGEINDHQSKIPPGLTGQRFKSPRIEYPEKPYRNDLRGCHEQQ